MAKTDNKIRKIIGESLSREVRMDSADVDEENRTIEIAFSSDVPVRQWFGDEILDHGPESVRLSRLQNSAAVLVNHDTDDQVGVVESARVDKDGKGRASIRFGKSQRANEIFADVTDGIRQLVSVGYRVHQLMLEESNDTGDVYRVTDWEPHEVSIVAVPADVSVGVGRSAPPNIIEVPKMKDEIKTPEPVAPAEPKFDAKAARAEIAAEIGRTAAGIRIVAAQAGMDDEGEKFILEGRSVEEFIAHVGQHAPARREASPDIGLTPKETKQFRMTNLILAQAYPQDRKIQEMAAFELEAVEAAAQSQPGHAQRGMVIPNEIFSAPMGDMLQAAQRANLLSPLQLRILTAGTATDGAEMVATDLRTMDFIDVLRNRLVVMAAGAVMLDGLVGDVAIPRKTSGSAGGWIATEGGNAAVSDPQFDQVTLTPKTVASYVDFSRNLLLQSSLAIEAMVRMDQAAGLATAIDLGALYGSGASGQPTGVTQTNGINAPTAFAAAVPTWLEVLAMESAVAVDNADFGSLAYITEPAMRGSLKGTDKSTSTARFVWEDGNMVNGYPGLVTSQVTSGDIFFANWADLLIGAWGGLDVLVDPYTGSIAGTVRVVSHQSVDVGVRHPVSFCFNNDT